MNFLWSLLGALLPAAAGMLVLVIGAFCSLFSLDANSQMGPGIGLIFVAAAIRLLDRKKRLMLAPRAIAAPNPLQKLAYALTDEVAESPGRSHAKPFAKAFVFI